MYSRSMYYIASTALKQIGLEVDMFQLNLLKTEPKGGWTSTNSTAHARG